jgi:hypothetical protein
MYKGLVPLLLFLTRSCLPAIHLLQTLVLLSRKTIIIAASVHSPLPSCCDYSCWERRRFMGKGKNSRATSIQKITEVDEDQVLEVIENKEFLAMMTATSAWPIPTITEDQLKELVDDGLIQE